jgi:hypothetical protein
LTTNKKIDRIEKLSLESLVVRKFGQTFQIYPILKSRWFHRSIMGKELLKEKNLNELIFQIKSIFYGFFNFFRRYDNWVFSHSADRELINGRQVDKLFDYLANKPEKKTLLFELRLFKIYKRKDVASKYVVSKSPIILLEEIVLRLLKKRYNTENEYILKEIEKEMGVKIDYDSLIRKHLAQYIIMKWVLKFAPNPSIVFMSVSYSHFGYIRAFKEKNIRVIEMQHGLIGESHEAYYYTKEFDSIQFPDEIVVLGESDKINLQEHSLFPVKKINVVGSYIIDYFFNKVDKPLNIKKTISVALQDEELSFQLLDFVLACNEKTNSLVNWVIQTRRTPKETYIEHYKSFPDNITFSNESIYWTILKSDIHLTIYSTTAIESLSLGREVILMNLENKASNYLGKLLEGNQFTTFLNSVEDFISYINSYKSEDPIIIAKSNNQNIKFGYRKNMDSYLNELYAIDI